jgi:hypothetical protein
MYGCQVELEQLPPEVSLEALGTCAVTHGILRCSKAKQDPQGTRGGLAEELACFALWKIVHYMY